eukprot:COSAG06_NODE_5096_length_3722_cov_3.695004_9_plen_119_part_01
MRAYVPRAVSADVAGAGFLLPNLPVQAASHASHEMKIDILYLANDLQPLLTIIDTSCRSVRRPAAAHLHLHRLHRLRLRLLVLVLVLVLLLLLLLLLLVLLLVLLLLVLLLLRRRRRRR